MVDWLLSRTTVIGMAVIGGLLSLLVSWCQAQTKLSQPTLVWLNKAAYAFMAVSIALFIAAGMFGSDN